RGVARDDEEVCAGLLEVFRGGHQRGRRILAIAEDGGRPVGDLRIVVDDQAEVVLIDLRGGQSQDLLKQIERGPRPHAAQYPDHLVRHLTLQKTIVDCELSILNLQTGSGNSIHNLQFTIPSTFPLCGGPPFWRSRLLPAAHPAARCAGRGRGRPASPRPAFPAQYMPDTRLESAPGPRQRTRPPRRGPSRAKRTLISNDT